MRWPDLEGGGVVGRISLRLTWEPLTAHDQGGTWSAQEGEIR